MRTLQFLIAGWLLFAAGCSAFIVTGGADLTNLTTRAEVQQKFGPSCTSGDKDGYPYDCYISRQKIARSQLWQQGYLKFTGFTLGLSEFVIFPLEACRATFRVLFGQEIVVTYDAAGNVTSIDAGPDRIYPHQKAAAASDEAGDMNSGAHPDRPATK